MVTCNHVHLLVQDSEPGSIARSMQLIAGRTAQEYNRRKERKGAFWEDRYFATAVESDRHLLRCLVYIDLNMVRAGVVDHPAQWPVCGFNEIQSPPQRYRIIDLPRLCQLVGITDVPLFQSAHKRWVESTIDTGEFERQPQWTESIAIGSSGYVEQIKRELGMRALYRDVLTRAEDSCEIKDGISC